MPMYYDRDGQPLEMMDWARYMEDEAYRRVGSTMVRYRWWVSTIWLGLDHNFMGPPMIFETAVFDHHDIHEYDITLLDGRQIHEVHADSDIKQRYTTLDQAERGHRHWVREYRRKKVRDG